MGWIEIPQGQKIVATDTGPSIEDVDPFPKTVVTLLSFFYFCISVQHIEDKGIWLWFKNSRLTYKIQNFDSVGYIGNQKLIVGWIEIKTINRNKSCNIQISICLIAICNISGKSWNITFFYLLNFLLAIWNKALLNISCFILNEIAFKPVELIILIAQLSPT